MNLASRLAAAHADTAELASVAGVWAVVAGVPCQHVDLPYPWATSGRMLALPGPHAATVVTEVASWLAARSPQWTVFVRAEDAPSINGFVVWELMPALRLAGPVPVVSTPGDVSIGPAHTPAEFLEAYGAELAPTVTEAHLRSPFLHHLVARVDGQAVGCVRLRLLGDTAHLRAITVVPAWRGRAIGAALTAAASELGASYTDLVWLHCTPSSRPLYERLGYRHVDDHAHLVPASPGDPAG
jgi:N-acetylglutamate synthase-like GNAT family acetyltransferase